MKHLQWCIVFVLTVTATAQWSNYQSASLVLGQTAFNTSATGTTASTFEWPHGVAVDAEHSKLYVSDFDNFRILRFSLPIAAFMPTAEAVFGQSDMISGAYRPVSSSTFYLPNGISVHNGDLWVADEFNHRVLKFSSAYSAPSGAAASLVIGQTNFTSSASTLTSTGLQSPSDITFDGGNNLWVADWKNNRVLCYGPESLLMNGSPATKVLGQSSFTQSVNARSAAGMYHPSSVRFFGTTLWVYDVGNGRVLRFDNVALKPNGSSADGVLGQANFTAFDSTHNQSTMAHNYMNESWLCTDNAGRLYVSDRFNCRILIFNNAAAKANGADADYLLGQPSFTEVMEHCTQSGLDFPCAVAVDNIHNTLYVADGTNSRVMVFTALAPLTVSSARPLAPEEFILEQNYPNPFNPTTVIGYQLSASGVTTLKIYDALCRDVATLVNEVKEAGTYSQQFDGTRLSSGMYFARLTSNGRTQIRKLLLMK